jgi:hypothetical protein
VVQPTHPVIVVAPPPPPPGALPPKPPPPPAVLSPAPRVHRAVAEKLVPLDQKILETVVKGAHPRLSDCLRRYSADVPATTGQITIEVTVASTGKVSAARALMPEVRSSGLGSCLATEATRLKFPRNSDKQVSFRFPLVYRKGQ